MAILLNIILGVAFLLICISQLALCYVNDIRLPKLKLDKLTGKSGKIRILAIDPHPDDETMISGGFLAYFGVHKDVEVKHICFTQGEKGDELLKISEKELAIIRQTEYVAALGKLGCANYAILDFPDGRLNTKIEEIKLRLQKDIESYKPDVILTYERSGLYGHPDHIALSKAVHDLVEEKHIDTKVLYKTLPKNVLKNIKLPIHMANGVEVKQALPKYRLPVLNQFWKKYQAARQHKSQNVGQGKPLWILMLLFTNEYFTDTY